MVAAVPAQPTLADLSPAACAARLAELFPALFATGTPLPLKLRIQADIQVRAPGVFTRKSLSTFLHRHTTSTAYLRAIVSSPQRIDLDGQPAGEMADEHRQAAVVELERRRAMHDERRASEREAQRREHEASRRAREADDVQRRERALLSRAFETTTLTRANFCALKGITEAELDAVLAQARLDPKPLVQGPAPVQQRPRRDPRGAERRPAFNPRKPR